MITILTIYLLIVAVYTSWYSLATKDFRLVLPLVVIIALASLAQWLEHHSYTVLVLSSTLR